MNKKRVTNSLVVNIRTIAKNSTKLNISADALREMRELTEDFFLPLVIKWAEKSAVEGKKKTIQENDYMVAKDYITTAIKSYGLIG
jgi:histone H3/H4